MCVLQNTYHLTCLRLRCSAELLSFRFARHKRGVKTFILLNLNLDSQFNKVDIRYPPPLAKSVILFFEVFIV